MRKKAFTLIELVLALVTFSIIFLVLFTLFLRMIHMKTDIEARQVLIKNTYDAVEKINVMLQDYTIDYEEYFNRGMIGCTDNTAWGNGFTWSVAANGNCTNTTAFGNNTTLIEDYSYVEYPTQHKLYACSSFLGGSNVVGPNIAGDDPDTVLIVGYDKTDPDPLACAREFRDRYSCGGGGGLCLIPDFKQPYGAYKVQFLDVKDDVDDKFGRAGDDDDTDTGKGPAAIFDNQHVKELYLISKDKKKRVILRRNLVSQGDWNNTGGVGDIPSEKLYTIQMLQLKGFDAGNNHDFQADVYSGVYDGVIDTWACDVEAGFECNGQALGGIGDPYENYNLPDEGNPQDGWVNITPNDITVTDRNMIITPTKDPEYAWGEPNQQRNPFITFYIKTAIYGENWVNKIGIANINNVVFDLQTSFNIKTNY